MVRSQIEGRGVRDPDVLAAMRRVPRDRFVPASHRAFAFEDGPLPIGHDQTISQPYVVAAMTEALRVAGGQRVLEIGTGSGYQTAVLAELGAEVFSLENTPELAAEASARLEAMGYLRVHVRAGDGFDGWPAEAPFDRLIVTAAPPDVPPVLLDQLAVGGRMVLPVGTAEQVLVVLEKGPGGVVRSPLFAVRFVPMVRGLRGQ
jgi:protein-L-isoaspartate(D-aspartate) O-methyltransferase